MGFLGIMRRLTLGFALQHDGERYEDLESRRQLRVEEELKGETENFELVKFRGFLKAFPIFGRKGSGGAIKSDTCRWRYDEVTRPGDR